MNLRAVKQEHELKRQRASKACGEQSSTSFQIERAQIFALSQTITSTKEERNRNKGNEETFSSDHSATDLTEGEEIETKTVKDAEC